MEAAAAAAEAAEAIAELGLQMQAAQEAAAAGRLQASWRRVTASRELRAVRAAALRIQSSRRGQLGRAAVAAAVAAAAADEAAAAAAAEGAARRAAAAAAAAVRLQAAARGRRVRTAALR